MKLPEEFDIFKYIVAAIIVLLLTFFGLIVWVAFHFVTKYW